MANPPNLSVALVFAAGIFAACANHNPHGTDAGTVSGADGGVIDDGIADAGVEDSGVTDAGIPDAGVIDAGIADAGILDAGLIDAGIADAGEPDAGSTAACGCNGMAGCAVWMYVYTSWYGYNDNSCQTESQHGCADIANPGLGPQMHTMATAGTGTYDDPSTAASSDTTDRGHVFETADGVTLTPGTLIYNPEVEQYFIFEDSCLECGDEYSCALSSNDHDDPAPPANCVAGQNLHIDFWMGPNNQKQPHSLQTCEDNATLGAPYGGIGAVVVNPPPNLPVKTGLLYPGDGGCFTARQVAGDSCE